MRRIVLLLLAVLVVPEAPLLADDPSPSPTRTKLLELLDKLRAGDPAAAWQALDLGDEAKAELRALIAEDRAALESFAGDEVRRRVLEDARRAVRQTRLQVLVIVQDEGRYGNQGCSEEDRAIVEEGIATIVALESDPYRWWFEKDEKRADLRGRYAEAVALAERTQALSAEETARAKRLLEGLKANLPPSEILGDPDLDRFSRYDKQQVRPWNEKHEVDLDESSREVVRLVNEYRRWMGLRPLRIEPRLVKAAKAHSQEMEDLGYFSHTSPTAKEKTPADRARNQGFESHIVGENIAQGENTPREIVEAWQRSPGHHQALLDGRFSTLGCARVGESWTLMFGGEPRK